MLSQSSIGTEHILLGLLRENEGTAIQILLTFDPDLRPIRSDVIRRVTEVMRPSPESVQAGPIASDLSAAAQTPERPDEGPRRHRVALQIEFGITTQAHDMQALNQAAIDAVERVYRNGGADLHYLEIRTIDP